ncbi:diguanylate cyclase domain-containing protein [Ningiella sp. W23]|uniref:GGDEF domain-containing response regulator n=1 Tax=Ningiella sp. W23 TaxID=3023715 RepID=UPI0037568CD2
MEHLAKAVQAAFKIMLVEESDLERKLYSSELSPYFSLNFVQSNEKAWEVLNRSPLPDAIILNMQEDNSDSVDLCHRLKEQTYFKDIPVIFLSNQSDTQNKYAAFDSGGADYLQKPVQMNELRMRLTRHIELYHKTKRLESLIYIDPLTHLPNAAKFNEILEQEWARCARYWHHLALIMVRIDNFQSLKRNFGADEYYAVTASIADDLCSVGARPGDLFASYAQDTFVLLLSDCSSEGAKQKARQIRNKFDNPHFMAKHQASAKDIGCTIAVTIAAPAGGSSTKELIDTAEEVLANCDDDHALKICCADKLLGLDEPTH